MSFDEVASSIYASHQEIITTDVHCVRGSHPLKHGWLVVRTLSSEAKSLRS